MSLGYYGILIIFAAFFLLLIFRPSLTCFGRKIKSPFYPLFRRKKLKKKLKTQEESPVDESRKKNESEPRKKKLKTQDYGFSLVNDDEQEESIK